MSLLKCTSAQVTPQLDKQLVYVSDISLSNNTRQPEPYAQSSQLLRDVQTLRTEKYVAVSTPHLAVSKGTCQG